MRPGGGTGSKTQPRSQALSGTAARLRTHLHGADAQAPVDHELAEGGRALVAVAAVHHEQPAEVLELSDGEVGSQRSLLPFLKSDEMGPRQRHKRSKRTHLF